MAPLSISLGNFIGSSTLHGGSTPTDDRFIFTVKTDNAGTSTDTQFTIPTSTTGITQAFLYDIETSDGQSITGLTGDTTITFPSAGEYEVRISGSFPYMRFANGGDKLKMLDIKNFGIYALGSTSQSLAFRGCSNMTITATDSGNFGDVTDFGSVWQNCSSLTSFPLIDTSSGIGFYGTWYNCSSLTSFPLIDTSSGTNFFRTWYNCSSLANFPLIDTSSCTSFQDAWRFCSSLTSFPLLDTSSGTNFVSSWFSCSNLANFPANAFDNNIATNYGSAFTSTNLTTQSIDDILVILDTNGVSNGSFTQSGGNAPSATGETAIDSLVGKGWTITVTGGYTPPQLLLDQYPNAAAAYSLRALSTATVDSAVVKVRRSSDNTEQDFSAAEITDGTLTTFCNPIGWFEDINLFQTFISNGNNGFSGTDNTGQANAIITIEDGGVGDIVNITFDVNEITGNLDVYLLNNGLAASNTLNTVIGANSLTLTPTGNYNQISFVLTNPPSSATVDNFTINREIIGRPLNGFVTTWYDQSENSNDATQATAINQPQLVLNGVTELDNGKACIDWNTKNLILTNRISNVNSVFEVANAEISTGAFTQYLLGDTSFLDYASGDFIIDASFSAAFVRDGDNYLNGNLTNFTTNTRPLQQTLYSMIHTSASGRVNQLTMDRTAISRSWQGRIQEIILYPLDQSANRTAIENSINTEYTIY